MWLGSNLQYKGLKEVLDGMSSVTKKEPTVDEVNNDWKRLASFMSGQR